ncbi:DUF3823 domain-containing protein [Pedobacter frigiditerrae]|uniref:DUF3823 domain-containing protein n=1 Tax=Pedobacter frigiditerrae TaxID=2530452 RepID=A0A4V2MJB7_9SPHI|nr:DUF3823 domain-containing protein [Pedobacter frigiditerrae]TCC93616.1 DUF3823 domain-containing protein [Pedobacter frigiditerrae]
MKRITYYIAICLALLTASSCSKYDNYAAPDQTVKGVVTDAGTGKAIQTEVTTTDGSMTAGTRIRLVETSYSPTATPQFLGSRQDGSFTNTKLFAATYTMTPEGAFVPPTPKVVEVKGGTTEVNFSVEPFLRIEWVGEPTYDAATGKINAQYTITRGTANASYQEAIGDCVLYLNNTQYVGNTNFTLFTRPATPALTVTNSVASPVLPKGREMFLRVGARIGSRLYNYSTVKSVTIPN